MTGRLRLALAASGLLAMPVAASPVAAAGGGSAYSACVAHHATSQGGFSREHDPGMHRCFADWGSCRDA